MPVAKQDKGQLPAKSKKPPPKAKTRKKAGTTEPVAQNKFILPTAGSLVTEVLNTYCRVV